jgi:signal transduction histidine kinase/CheY-like chemotaxis protein
MVVSSFAWTSKTFTARCMVRLPRDSGELPFVTITSRFVPRPDPPAFLTGGGEMGARVRDFDWSATSIGSIDTWSPALRGAVGTVLAHRFPHLLWWGPQYVQVYNDAHRPIHGARHPHRALGRSAEECWAEAWPVLQPLVDAAFRAGSATWMDDIVLEIDRRGFVEECHFTMAFGAVPDETAPGGVGGVLATMHEITDRVIGVRREAVLHDLGDELVTRRSADEVCLGAAQVLSTHTEDVPFAILYLLDPGGSRARLAAVSGGVPDDAAPAAIDIGDDDAPWPLAAVLRDGARPVHDLASRFAAVPAGPWPDPPRAAFVLPLRAAFSDAPVGVLIAGLSPRLELDAGYERFLARVAARIARDVTALHGQTPLAALLDHAPLGVCLTDADFRIRCVNPIGLRVFAGVPGGPVGRDLGEVIHRLLADHAIADEVVRTCRHTLETGEPYVAPERAEAHVDHEVGDYWEWRLERVAMPDGRHGLACYFRDVSQQVMARIETTRAVEAAREADRRKDEFLATLAHELRNPLAPVRNAAHYLKLRNLADPELKAPVEMIERQVAHMTRLIDDLFDVSRIARGVLELRRERLEFREAVENAVDACRTEVEGRGHELRIQLPDGPLPLDADRHRLVQVLCNLISNAAKYTPAGGVIELSARVVGATLEVHVRDNGVGIPSGKLTEIFELFTQLDRSLERQGGLGIGLTLARQLIVLHGGSIEARSEGLGRGSTFIVRLPALGGGAATTPGDAAGAAVEVAEPRRILVADDNRDAAESLALLLRASGHVVRVVFDGRSALDQIAGFQPSVAFLDIGMPAINGYDLARRIRQDPSNGPMHLVAVTGWGQEEDRRRAEAAGFDTHLVKPISPASLERLLAMIEPGAESLPR